MASTYGSPSQLAGWAYGCAWYVLCPPPPTPPPPPLGNTRGGGGGRGRGGHRTEFWPTGLGLGVHAQYREGVGQWGRPLEYLFPGQPEK